MKYNINDLCTSFSEKYDISTFDCMPSFKDLVIYLLSYILNVSSTNLKLDNNIELTSNEIKKLDKYIDKVVNKHIPIEYITGYTYVYNEKYLVNKHVLIPRQDTETLIEVALDEINNNKYKSLLDICTGSGVIAISTTKNSNISDVTISDISRKALKVAIKNAALNKLQSIKVVKSNLFNKIEKNITYDIITANPPYITKQEMIALPNNVKHEPKLALYGGDNGLDYYIKIINEAYRYLSNNGALILEIGMNQKDDVLKIINDTNKYSNIYVKKDINGKDRVIVCHFQKK